MVGCGILRKPFMIEKYVDVIEKYVDVVDVLGNVGPQKLYFFKKKLLNIRIAGGLTKILGI